MPFSFEGPPKYTESCTPSRLFTAKVFGFTFFGGCSRFNRLPVLPGTDPELWEVEMRKDGFEDFLSNAARTCNGPKSGEFNGYKQTPGGIGQLGMEGRVLP